MKCWGYEVMPVSNEDIASLLGLDIVAFQIAEGGAMGYHGGVFFVTSDKRAYSTCYLEPSAYTGFSKSISWDNLEKIFPPLIEFNHGLMGHGTQTPQGWYYEYLGAGNHLLVRDDRKKRFLEESDKFMHSHPGKIMYNTWMAAIISIL